MFTKTHFTNLRFKRHLPLMAFALLTISKPIFSKAQSPTTGAAAPSSFTARLMNIEAATSETFRYTTTLHNGSAKTAIYELQADLPPGWMITYRVEGSQVTSLNLDAGKSQDISIEINVSAGTKPDKYKIPVKATSATDALLLSLEAVVKGTYAVELTTPTGRLTDEVTAGSSKDIHLVVKNTGSLPLKDIELSSQLPSSWECTFDPAKIASLEPGKTVAANAKLRIPDKTIAGDYISTFTARNTNSNAQAVFRVVVTTSFLSGWVGILVILLAIGLVYYLVRKYGRR